MKFFNQRYELSLNILQILYACRDQDQYIKASELADKLLEGKFMMHLCLRDLKLQGLVTAMGGIYGGYKIVPGIEARSLYQFFKHYELQHIQNPLYNYLASNHLGHMIDELLHKTRLIDIFSLKSL